VCSSDLPIPLATRTPTPTPTPTPTEIPFLPPQLGTGIMVYWKLDDDGSNNVSLLDSTE